MLLSTFGLDRDAVRRNELARHQRPDGGRPAGHDDLAQLVRAATESRAEWNDHASVGRVRDSRFERPCRYASESHPAELECEGLGARRRRPFTVLMTDAMPRLVLV